MLNSASQLRVELPSEVLGFPRNQVLTQFDLSLGSIELGYVVGGGGGHTLRINNATLQSVTFQSVNTRLRAAGFPRDQVLQALLNTQGIEADALAFLRRGMVSAGENGPALTGENIRVGASVY